MLTLFETESTTQAARVTVQARRVPKPVTLTYERYYVQDSAEVPAVVAWLASLKDRRVCIDYETTGLSARHNKPITLQLGAPWGPTPTVYILDLRTVGDVSAVFRQLQRMLVYGQNLKFEAKFTQHHFGIRFEKLHDTMITEQVLRAGLLTSKGAEQARGEGRIAYRFASMEALALRYLGVELDKDEDLRRSFGQTLPGQFSERQLVYAAGDVLYPGLIFDEQWAEVQQRELVGILDIEYRLIPVLADTELHGFRMDTAAWLRLSQEATIERAKAQRQLDDLIRPFTTQLDLFSDGRPVRPDKRKAVPINYSSSQDVQWVIKTYCEKTQWPMRLVMDFKELIQLKRVWGRDWLLRAQERDPLKGESDIPDHVLPETEFCVLLTTDRVALTLAKVRNQLPAALVDPLVQYSKYDIRVDTFGASFIEKHVDPTTGCVHTDFHQAVTSTGRLSTSPNLQNIPGDSRYRRCFIPHPGYVFVTCDYSQIEPRISAEVSQDPVYVNTFVHADDLYVSVCEAMTGHRPNKKTPEGSLERSIFKTVVLALAYNMGPRKLRDRLTLALADDIAAGRVQLPTYERALELWKRFFEVHERIREAQQSAITLADPEQSTRRVFDRYTGNLVTWVTAPCGRKRFFPHDAKSVYTEAPNVEPQAGSATITKAAGVLLAGHMWQNGIDGWISNLVHDEIVCCVRADQAKAFAPKMKHLMERAGAHFIKSVPVVAEFPENTDGITPYWAKKMDKTDGA